jgi:hypothetical protein
VASKLSLDPRTRTEFSARSSNDRLCWDPLGPYAILSPLGSGGMGEAYRPRDTRLECTVAIKVLPSGLSSSAEVRQRFERRRRRFRSSLSLCHTFATLGTAESPGQRENVVLTRVFGSRRSERLVVRFHPPQPFPRMAGATPSRRARLVRPSERLGFARVWRRLQPHASHWTSHRAFAFPGIRPREGGRGQMPDRNVLDDEDGDHQDQNR